MMLRVRLYNLSGRYRRSDIGLGYSMDFHSFFSDICTGVLSGVVLTVLFFLMREWWHPVPRLSGTWYFETHTETSTLSTYRGLRLKYEATVLQAGSEISGSTEKIFEHNANESFAYENAKRSIGELRGYVDRFYLRKNRLSIHLVEHGRSRESSAVFDLVEKDGEWVGTFSSTAASTSGRAVWSRDQHSKSFSELIRNELSTLISHENNKLP